MDSAEHSLGTRFMAKRCDTCPACKYARNHPETRFGRVMAWHGSWCPFWKAQEKVYGKESSSGGMRAG
jgi:hypothetical protein